MSIIKRYVDAMTISLIELLSVWQAWNGFLTECAVFVILEYPIGAGNDSSRLYFSGCESR